MNPNGLTDEQIAARPGPFVGMLVYGVGGDWRSVVDLCDEPSEHDLLPGEPGCPWPPPEEFRHSWKRGDRAWIFADDEWKQASVSVSGGWSTYGCSGVRNGFYWRVPGSDMRLFIAPCEGTPAIYIPNGV